MSSLPSKHFYSMEDLHLVGALPFPTSLQNLRLRIYSEYYCSSKTHPSIAEIVNLNLESFSDLYQSSG